MSKTKVAAKAFSSLPKEIYIAGFALLCSPCISGGAAAAPPGSGFFPYSRR